MRRQVTVLIFVCLALVTSAAGATDIHVVSSGGFAAALKALAPGYEQATGDKLVLGWGPSMGETHDAIPARLARGEDIDVVIMVGDALGKLADERKIVLGTRADLARSLIGAAVRAGAPHPDISTPEALKQALLNAESIAYSDSASGVYIQNELLLRLGIADRVAGKAHMIPATPVGEIVARGEAEIGFQQIAELKPVHGIDQLGPIPAELQKVTIYSAGVVTGAHQVEAGKAFIAYLASPRSSPAISETGLEPIVQPQ
jgi:molybdate transport system substrate-binding protein